MRQVGGALGVPFAVLLVRCCEAIGVPMDWVTLLFLTWNVVVPGVLLVQWGATVGHFAPGRRLYAAVLASLCSWFLTSVPYQTLTAMLGIFAALDVLLVALPCCSPVRTLNEIDRRRQRAGEAQMPGLTFHAPGEDGLFLGFGDFVVFSVFCTHASRAGVAPLAAVATGVLAGLVLTMTHVALQWPKGALEPAIPLSVLGGAILLAIERFVLQPLIEDLAIDSAWI